MRDKEDLPVKILVFSDSHGNDAAMTPAVEREKPQMILHLGDGWRDAQRLQNHFPDIPLHQVPGNCDFRSKESPELLLTIQDKRVLLCHGHTLGVKSSLLTAGLTAEDQDLDLFLFGHTHMPLVDRRGKTLFMNPGSIGDFQPSYGVVTIEDGKLDGKIVPLPRS